MKKIIAIMLFATAFSFGIPPCHLANVISQIRPGSKWTMVGEDTGTLVFVDSSVFPTDTEITNGVAACQANQTQIAAWQLELSTTTAAVTALGNGYVGASVVTQLSYNAKLVRIAQLRQLLGLP